MTYCQVAGPGQVRGGLGLVVTWCVAEKKRTGPGGILRVVCRIGSPAEVDALHGLAASLKGGCPARETALSCWQTVPWL